MNNPETLATFTSLLLFANNPSARHIELKGCDYPHQATIQALAMKLNLQCFRDVSSATVYLRKYSNEETIAGLGQQLISPLGESSNPVSIRFEDRSNQPNRTNEAHASFTAHVPGSDQDFGENHNFDLSSDDLHVNECNHGAFAEKSPLRGTEYRPLLSPTAPPSRPPPRYRLSSDNNSSLSLPSLVESHSWRESFPTLSRTLKVIGACWRCKILRKKVPRPLHSRLYLVDIRSATQISLAKHVREPRTNLGGKTSVASEEISSTILHAFVYALRSSRWGVDRLGRAVLPLIQTMKPAREHRFTYRMPLTALSRSSIPLTIPT